MSAQTFDSLNAARELEAAGIESEQAAAIASQIRTVATPNSGEIATKSDVAKLCAEFYRALWLQAGGIIAATVTLVKLIPGGGA
ncbi:MAG: hypothetical protein OXE81_07725 [Gammaproteobacteria bacterium]|nr:hypothetical protein [Gammaproteobacteria bacterium]MCY4277707.1 hypothetical protein [Gammaproteobacteria bacterium]